MLNHWWGPLQVLSLALNLDQLVLGNSPNNKKRFHTWLNYKVFILIIADIVSQWLFSLLMDIKYNDWMCLNPTYETTQLSQRGRAGPHYVTVKFPLEMEQGGKEWAGAVNADPENRPCVVKGVRVHMQTMNESTSPLLLLPCFRLVPFFLLCRVPPSFPLLRYPGISLRGRNPPLWGLRGCIMRINELEVNMQSVCCMPHYNSQPIGFHQKLRWIVSPTAQINVFQCFIYLMWSPKALLKGFNMHLCSTRNTMAPPSLVEQSWNWY